MCCHAEQRGWRERESCQQCKWQCWASIQCHTYVHWLSRGDGSSWATWAWCDSISAGSGGGPKASSAPWFRKASHGRHGRSFLLARGDLFPLVSVQWDTSDIMLFMLCLYCITCPPGTTQKIGLRVCSPVLAPWKPYKICLRLLVDNISLQQASSPVLLKAFHLPLGYCANCYVSARRHWLLNIY